MIPRSLLPLLSHRVPSKVISRGCVNACAFLTEPRPWFLCRAELRRPSNHRRRRRERKGKGSLCVLASRQKTIWTAASDFLDMVDRRIVAATQCNEMDVAVFAVFAAAVIHDSYLWSVSLSLSRRLVSNLLRSLLREIYTSPFSAV